MAAADLAAANVSQLGGVAQLISSLSPIFLGSGKTSGTTASTTQGSQQQTQTQTSTSNPDIIAQLLAQMNQANTLANDPKAVQGIIDNIIRLNTLAFAPVVGQANAAGIYNSSTLGLLAGEASAASSAQTASAALNFKQQEQAISAGIGSNLLNAQKTTQSTGGTTTVQNTSGQTTQQTAPVTGSILSTLLGIGGLFAANKLFGGSAGSDSPVTDLISSLFGGKQPGASTFNSPDTIAASFPASADVASQFADLSGNIGGVAVGAGSPFPQLAQLPQ